MPPLLAKAHADEMATQYAATRSQGATAKYRQAVNRFEQAQEQHSQGLCCDERLEYHRRQVVAAQHEWLPKKVAAAQVVMESGKASAVVVDSDLTDEERQDVASFFSGPDEWVHTAAEYVQDSGGDEAAVIPSARPCGGGSKPVRARSRAAVFPCNTSCFVTFLILCSGRLDPRPSPRETVPNPHRGRSSIGRALRSQCRGRGFDSLRLHLRKTPQNHVFCGVFSCAGRTCAVAVPRRAHRV